MTTNEPERPSLRDSVDWVSASEVNTFVFCSKAYHLENVRRSRPDERAMERMDEGTEKHHTHGVAMDRQRAVFRWGWTLLLAGAAVLALVLWLLEGG